VLHARSLCCLDPTAPVVISPVLRSLLPFLRNIEDRAPSGAG